MFFPRCCRIFDWSVKVSCKIGNARRVSNYKRSPMSVPHSDHLQALKTDVLQQRNKLSSGEWQNVRDTLISKYKYISASNVDAIILGLCSSPAKLSLAKNYVQHLRDSAIEPNTATLGRLLRIYNAVYHARGGEDISLSTDEQKEILSICAVLRERFEVLEATTCENLIYGLVCTSNWRSGEELLEMMKLTSKPTTGAYTELIVKAFSEKELALGWRLLEEMTEKRKQPKCEIFLAYLQQIANDVTTFRQNFEKLLIYLGNHDVTITVKVANYIEKLVESLPDVDIKVKSTHVSNRGKCGNCRLKMTNITVSDVEYARLSNSFLNKVLIRNDVFQKSTPQEVERFKSYILQTAPYDCVIDGLNVAYSMGGKKPTHVLAKLLANVVKYFVDKNKRLLVLGRKHMNSWPKDSMQFISKNACIFLTNNLSHDDPFLLYATLRSGESTDFCSRDLMRSHAFLLGPELRMIFRRWQQEHQYSLLTQTESGRIIVKEPIRYMLFAHKVQNTWHLPFKQEYSANPSETFTIPENWLCIKFQNL